MTKDINSIKKIEILLLETDNMINQNNMEYQRLLERKKTLQEEYNNYFTTFTKNK